MKTLAALAVASEDKDIFFLGRTDPAYGSLSFSTVLSLPYAIENVVPLLAAELQGAATP